MTHNTKSESQPSARNHHPPRTRRLSSCYLHPAAPASGICASCLRERLCGLDSSADLLLQPSSLCNGDLAGGAGPVSCMNKAAAAAATAPELRRCRSVVTARCEASTGFSEPRRKSCDVSARNGKSLANLFDVDDEFGSRSNVESKNIVTAATRAAEFGDEIGEIDVGGNGDRDPYVAFTGEEGDEGDNLDEGEVKTMKEHIDLELQSKNQKLKDFKELTGNIKEAASVLSKKLQKWRQKQKKKLVSSNDGGTFPAGSSEVNGPKGKKLGETHSVTADYAMGRRSCDIEPRFSVDAGRLSLDGGRISFDEPRASWDGYMIARTIPTLAPMLSVVENGILNGGNRLDHHRVSVDGMQMQSIMEDESSSGGSAQSNSDSSSSQRRSSFDRSSSVRSFGKKMVVLDGDYAKTSPAKLVITERELKDWHLNSMKDDHKKKSESSSSRENSPAVADRSSFGPKKPVRWRRVLNVFGFKQKSCEKICDKSMEDCSPAQDCERQENEANVELKDANHFKLTRSSSIVGARRSCEVIRSSNGTVILGDDSECGNRSREEFVLGRNQSAKYASRNLDDGVLPFYLTPLRTSRNRKSGRDNLRSSHFVDGSLLQLN